MKRIATQISELKPIEQSWILVRDAAPLFGMTFDSIKNLISQNKFPVPTYKLGRNRVIDKDVLQAFFEEQKAQGLKKLAANPKSMQPR